MIEHLQSLPQDALLYVSGYEGGLSDAAAPTKVERIRRNENHQWYYGSHEQQYESDLDGTESDGYCINGY